MKDVTIKIENARKAFDKADKSGKQLLSNLLGEETFKDIDITDRLKTIRDCVEYCGKDYDVEFSPERTKWETPDETAYREAKFIMKALNEGEEMDFSNPNQKKYYGYMRWVSGRGLSLDGVSYGASGTCVGPRLSLKNERLVRYAHSQFPNTFDKFFN